MNCHYTPVRMEKSEALGTQMLARTWNKMNSQLLPVGM